MPPAPNGSSTRKCDTVRPLRLAPSKAVTDPLLEWRVRIAATIGRDRPPDDAIDAVLSGLSSIQRPPRIYSRDAGFTNVITQASPTVSGTGRSEVCCGRRVRQVARVTARRK